jgi:imidazolonepropionase-like amidohydrolase
MRMTRRLGPALAVVISAMLAARAQSPETTAFTNITVVPLDSERSLPDHTVVVRGERIAAMGPGATVAIPTGAARIDGRGRFLMPGMAEMHAHIPGGQSPEAFMHRVLALFVANGVTTIRGMLGDPRHLTLRDRVARGEVIGPTIFTAGPSFNGTSVSSADVAVKMVRDQKAAGYDLLKVHPGVARDAFDAMAAEADRLGIRFAGHVPAAVGLERALAAKYHSIDHIDGFFEYAVRPGAPVDAANAGFFASTYAAYLDPVRVAKAVDETRRAGVWIVPTQGLIEIFMSPLGPDEMRRWPGVDLIPASVVEGWAKQRRQFMAQPGFSKETNDRFLAERRRLLKALHDAGVGIAMGSDAIQVFSVPGFSIHNEMGAMARSGLTPYQVYVTGSRNVARFLGRERDAGTIEVGKVADLVLVDADPLADVANFARQTGTMVRGRWHPRAALLDRIRTMP